MDVVFDIDGTLANAEHRLHHIRDMAHWVGVPPKPNWDEFLKDELVAKDAPVPETWQLLTTMLEQPQDYRVIFITGRRESTREMTYEWLRNQPNCKVRVYAWYAWEQLPEVRRKPLGPIIYMRPDGDRRPSAEVKRDLLKRAA